MLRVLAGVGSQMAVSGVLVLFVQTSGTNKHRDPNKHQYNSLFTNNCLFTNNSYSCCYCPTPHAQNTLHCYESTLELPVKAQACTVDVGSLDHQIVGSRAHTTE